MRLVCDIETDGLDPNVIHCLCVEDLDSNENWQFYGDTLETGIKVIADADETIWHNGIGYDIPAIKKIYPAFTPKKVTDTLVLSRMLLPDIKLKDFDMYLGREGDEILPKRLFGSHSLKAWGLRMANHKGDYTGGWDTFNDEMLKYCIQDVKVTKDLYNMLKPWKHDQSAIDAEHRCTEICERIGKFGWTFDTTKAIKLYSELAQMRDDLRDHLGDLFDPWEVHEWFTPKVNNSKIGYVKGEPFRKTKVVHFNPNSRRHIEHCLKAKYRWKPKYLTAQGHAQIDDTILSQLHYPEAQILSKYFMVQKRIGQLSEGSGAWLKKLDDDGKLRHHLVSSATVSGRCAHRSPNLGQVPAVRLPYGRECRELFTVDPGYVLLGADLSGLELRCLAHYMNDEDYIQQIESGDIHTYNQNVAGLKSRDQAKRMIYCLIYGGGDTRLGEIVDGGMHEGQAIRGAFMHNLPSYKELKKAVDVRSHTGSFRGLDGRVIKIRSKHSALNLLLQAAGATIARQWVINIQDAFDAENIDAHIVAWVHDEVQVAVRKGQEDYVGDLIGRMAEETQKTFNLSIPIRSEYKVGQNWAETH